MADELSLRQLFFAAAVREYGEVTYEKAFVIDFALDLLARYPGLKEGARELLNEPGFRNMSLSEMMEACKKIIYRAPG